MQTYIRDHAYMWMRFTCECIFRQEDQYLEENHVRKESKLRCEMGISLPDPSNYLQYASDRTYGACFVRRRDGGGSEP
jgi:hypothetical protein